VKANIDVLATDTLWVAETSVLVPTAVVTPDQASNGEILVPVTNFSSEPMLLEAGCPIAALDEPGEINNPIARVLWPPALMQQDVFLVPYPNT
jgi:hypothetical protein